MPVSSNKNAHVDATVLDEIARIRGFMYIKLEQASDAANDLIARFPNNFDALMFRSFLNIRLRRRQDALRDANMAGWVGPNRHEAHFQIGFCLMKDSNYRTALRAFKRASELPGPSNPLAIILLAVCLHRLGRAKETIHVLRQVVDRHPSNLPAKYCLMRAYMELNAFDEADSLKRNIRDELQNNISAQYELFRFLQIHDHRRWDEVDNKASLKRLVEHTRERHPGALERVPASFVMPGQFSALVDSHRANPTVWIVKPDNFFAGHGIRLIDHPTAAPREEGWLVQRYLDKPLLLKKRKANLRISILITSFRPLRAYLFRGAAARLAMEEYRGTSENLDKLTMHVDHQMRFLEGHDDLLMETKRVTGSPFNVLRFPELKKEIEKLGRSFDSFWEEITILAKDVVRMVGEEGIFAAQSYPGCRYGFAHKVMSLDVFVDEDMKPWLLEVERVPATKRLFDGALPEGNGENNPIFASVFQMVLFSHIASGGPRPEELRDDDTRFRHEAAQEMAHSGRFEQLAINYDL